MVAPGLLVYWFGSDLFYANIDRFFWVAGASRNPRFQLQSHPTVPRPWRRHVGENTGAASDAQREALPVACWYPSELQHLLGQGWIRTSEDVEPADFLYASIHYALGSEQREWCSELHRLRGVFLAAMGAEETQIRASFCEAIRIAKEQKSVSLEKRAEATFAEYRRQKASGSGARGFRLPLC